MNRLAPVFTAVAPASLGAALASLLLALAPASGFAADPDKDAAADAAAIQQHRMGTLVVRTAPGAAVRIEQTRHEFWFGAALASSAFNGRMPAADAAKYRQVFLENFNAAVTGDALKWIEMERTPGQVDYSTVDAILAWTERNHLPLRGHNLYWGVAQYTMDWQKRMDDATLRETVRHRALDIAGRYRGRFAEYDLNNEMIHGNFYADRLGPKITLEMAQWVREADPDAVLFVNDYDILTGARLDDYVAHIRGLLAMGVPLGGIGVQGHLHGDSFDPVALRHALDVLAQFHLPIRVTEFTFPGQRSKYYHSRHSQGPDLSKQELSPAEEEAKAKAIVEYYRICFAHPAVTGILMWGFWEGSIWIPQSSLFKRDWTPTPAGKAYHDLVFHQWWTRWEGKADAQGRCAVPAFFGSYRVTAGGKSVAVDLHQRAGTATVELP